MDEAGHFNVERFFWLLINSNNDMDMEVRVRIEMTSIALNSWKISLSNRLLVSVRLSNMDIENQHHE